MNTRQEQTKPHNFSKAFEQLCSVVAIADTASVADTLKQLVLQCFPLLPGEGFEDERQLANTINILFGLTVPEFEVRNALQQLVSDGSLIRPLDTNLILSEQVRTQLQASLDESVGLEARVRDALLREIEDQHLAISPDQVWQTFRSYLARAFGQHGILTAALLRPSIEIGPEYTVSLSSILDAAVNSHVPKDQREVVRSAITRFLNSVDRSSDLATFIAQLANGAFSYFSLVVAPEVSAELRGRLQPMTLFLDTNFLFGILDLHINPQVEVSNVLLQEIQRHNLPFKLSFHQATEKEMNSTIGYYVARLREHRWTRTLSRAALTSPYLSGIEHRFHEVHAERGVDVDAFLSPYEHFDVLLRDRNILIYRSNAGRLEERANLYHEYREFLERNGRQKPYEALDHDVTVLDTVHQLRSNAASSLDAGALLITCDYWLYYFDSEQSRAGGKQSVVLPSMLWQVLRPFVSSDPSFEKSFAATFALPEFRSIGNAAARADATSKMLNILAGYADLSEATASILLSNDLLLDRLASATDQTQIQEQVELAIAKENAALLEENAARSREFAEQQAEMARLQKEKDDIQKEKDERIAALQADVQQRQTEIEQATKRQQELEANTERARQDAAAQAEAEIQAKVEAMRRAVATAKRTTLIASVATGIAGIVLFEVLVHMLRWTWLVQNPNSLGLQLAAVTGIGILVRALYYPLWRKTAFSAGFALLLVAIALLGR